MNKPKKPKKRCLNCKKMFTVYREWARFCTPKCRLAYWQRVHPRISTVELEHLRKLAKEAEKSL